MFTKSHPGHHFCLLAKLKKWVVPKMYLPEGSLCNIGDLEIGNQDVDDKTKQIRENYANMVLIMLYPYRILKLEETEKPLEIIPL